MQERFRTGPTASPIYFIGVLVLSLAISVHAQEPGNACSAPTKAVPVGMQGLMCADGFFQIELADAVATGQGFQCDGLFDWTNKAWPNLVPDQTYTMTAGTGICVTTINFDVPEGYTLYIDGYPTKTVEKSDGGFIFTGDGSWQVVLRKDCNGNDKPGQGVSRQGSVDWQVGLGKMVDGRSAEHISIRQQSLSANTYTPGALIYSPPAQTSEVDVVRDANGSLRQVKAPQAFADVVAINGSEFEIRFYAPANVGAKVNGIYQLTGQPYVTWKITNPDPSTITKLRISKYEAGQPQPVDQTEYVWDPAIDSWTMYTGWSQSTGYARIETKTVSYPTATSRRESITVKEGSSPFTVVSRRDKTYLSYPWGEELVQDVVDPEGAALTTTYTYYEDPSFSQDHRYRKIKTIVFPDGSWEKRDYDIWFNISTVLRPWKDQPMETATIDNSNATIYGYTNSDNGVVGISHYPRIDYDVEERIQGVTVRKTRLNRSVASYELPQQIATAESSYSDSENGFAVNLIKQTSTIRYHNSAPQFLKNRVVSIEYPDGRKDSYTYEKGNYIPNADPALSQFTPDANGLAERDTIVHGNVASPQGIAFKTTKEVTVRDQNGNEVLTELYVYNGTDYERVEWTACDYDQRGHIVMWRNHKGEIATAVWNGEQKTSEINADGLESTYTYDSLGRMKTHTRKGIAAGGGFPAQADITTTFNYDAQGQPVGETIAGGGLSLSSSRSYDAAGRVFRETDHAGLQTLYSYPNGGRTKVTTRPGGATEVTDHYLDGQTKSLTGSGIVSRFFDYGVNADGTRYETQFIGSAGLSSPRWTRTTIDWVDRTVTTETPGFTGANVLVTFTYNQLSQLQKQTTTANSAKLLADRLFEYDALGREVRTGLDVDNSGTLTPASTDRVNEGDVGFEEVGSDWFEVSTARTYLVDNNSTAVSLTQRERLNNFPLNGALQTISEETLIDALGNQTKRTIAGDRAAKKQIVTTDTPDSNLDAVSIRVNGLLQSSSVTTPQTPTTYTYDGLGRQIGITDPRSGSSSRTFNVTTGQLATTNDGAGTTTYEYYPGTHLNAGQLKSQSNAASKKTYFAYNSRGEVVQTWGDTTYPLEYVYDSYGQQTELHTFRGGQNWSASIWPASTTGAADVTKWLYQEATGLVTQKLDAALKGATVSYDELGRLKTRVWARGITCTYGYDANTGELVTTTYSDSTPAVSFTYDRGGRQRIVTDAAGTSTRTFNVAGDIATEQIAGGLLDGVGMTVGYDGFLRRNSLQTTHGANTLGSQSYGYDATSRLETITTGSQTVTYAYHANSGLLNTTAFNGGTSIARSYDGLGRLENITTTPAADVPQSYVYTYNNLNQRTRVTREDGSYWSFIYNDRGELVSGKKYWSDNSIVWGAQTEYNFDNIGNRKYARNGGNQLGALRESTYTANSLNQYTQRSVPGAVDVTGTASTAATVTVNNGATVRKGEYFYKELAVDNSAGPVSQQITITGARNNFGAGGQDAISQKGGREFLPQGNETFTYDDDGNLASDGRWTYTWDAENNLVSMQAGASVPAEAKSRLEFSYDSARRRIQKKVYSWDVPSSTYTLQSVRKFVYDGTTLVAELDATFAIVRTYTWGQDAGGDLQTIAGIGGLLLISDGGNSYRVFYDGNGNVGGLVSAATGTLAASYEYDPFGSTLKSVGNYASQNPIRFSTKYTDDETDLVYYGFRYYQPDTGKWIGQDPIAESGGVNLSAFNSNDAVNQVDAQGLYEIDVHYYLTYFLAGKHRCFNDQAAKNIANFDQGTDEDPTTMPGPGWYPLPLDPTRLFAPNGVGGMIVHKLRKKGFPVVDNNDYRQQGANIYYHALHPGAAPGKGNQSLWNKATEKCGDFKALGQYMHYLQDTYSHEGYPDPACGHGCKDQHKPDHTIVSSQKTLAAAKATWDALNAYAKKMCNCEQPWDPFWVNQILEFARIGYGEEWQLRAFEGSDRDLNTKRTVLQLPTRYPGGGLRLPNQ